MGSEEKCKTKANKGNLPGGPRGGGVGGQNSWNDTLVVEKFQS